MTELKSVTFPHDNSVAFLDFNSVSDISADGINIVDESVMLRVLNHFLVLEQIFSREIDNVYILACSMDILLLSK